MSSSGPRASYAKRTDSNHAEIRDALRKIGVGVHDASSAGAGIPDLICVYRGVPYFVEVKDGEKSPSRRKLTVFQVQFENMLNTHGGKLHVVTSVDEALAVFGARAA